ncbi:hypothetical protein CSHISOI_10673 [Colletotrichum shisoi]|uniref:Circumsporozoite protein n=1 Tax=Colletotrichum shisoi TaxID=2078593 RepID=A0A5Q4BDE3_9PEZI|nr:hypothetical protein CSHISOI_10673 [Colletotrichum shisoi]
MSYSKILLISALLAFSEARFGQEQTPVGFVSVLQAGSPGEAATLAGGIPGSLLAAADPCAKLRLADKIAALGTDEDVLNAAKSLVAAEQNFNPFVTDKPNICGDASLPVTEALRGIVPLVDPSVTGSDTENANSAASMATPFDANGMSVAQVMMAHGFSNFTIKGQAADGAAGGAAGGNAGGNKNNSTDTAADDGCGGATGGNKGTANNQNNNNNNNDNGKKAGNNTDTNAGNAKVGGADFGKCKPTIDFQLGRTGRKATEGTFLPSDPLVAQGQQDALNPNIITNRVCDQLTNVCGANDAAKKKCKDAQAQILASGDRSAAVAATFNGILGF